MLLSLPLPPWCCRMCTEVFADPLHLSFLSGEGHATADIWALALCVAEMLLGPDCHSLLRQHAEVSQRCLFSCAKGLLPAACCKSYLHCPTACIAIMMMTCCMLGSAIWCGVLCHAVAAGRGSTDEGWQRASSRARRGLPA